jgi:SRSO17 transposase
MTVTQGHHPTQGGGHRRERGSSERRDPEKWRLALGLLDTLSDGQLKAPVVVADAGRLRRQHPFRLGLEQRGLSYVLSLTGKEVAHPEDAEPHQPAHGGLGPPTPARYRTPPRAVSVLAAETGAGPFTEVTWRRDSKSTMASRFAVLTVRPAGKQSLATVQEAGGGRNRWYGVLPTQALLVERSEGQDAPTGYWISHLCATTPVADLVRWAKMRWRIEHDYRELEHGLGLDHFEGRTRRGWHHHVTLAKHRPGIPHPQAARPASPHTGLPPTRSSISSSTF